MTPLPLIDCAEMLSIDPKTLRHWQRQANMPLHSHPIDARVKCLTMQQVQQLATLHGRILKPPPTPEEALVESSHLGVPETPTHTDMASSGASVKTIATASPEEADLSQKLFQLERHMTSMQQQLAQLALELAHERERRDDCRLLTFEALIQQTLGQQNLGQRPMPQEIQERAEDATSDEGQCRERRPHPAERRRHSVLPLIEYKTPGLYIMVCPLEGELQLVPDSAEWFAWLASLSSFRFVGKLGRFSACRQYDHGPKRSWFAYRYFHQHTYKHYLGVTEHLTLDCLEQMAAQLQSYVR
jgi:hypothetical protein